MTTAQMEAKKLHFPGFLVAWTQDVSLDATKLKHSCETLIVELSHLWREIVCKTSALLVSTVAEAA